MTRPQEPASDEERGEREPGGAPLPRIEIGWILLGRWSEEHRSAGIDAAEKLEDNLATALPAFEWRVEVAERDGAETDTPFEPVLLLDEAEAERDRHAWDFVFVLTERDLVSYTRSAAVAAPSSVFATAIISTARLSTSGACSHVLAHRLSVLGANLFGRLNGLEAHGGDGFMRDFGSAADLDQMAGFTHGELEHFRRRLASVADLRVEEMSDRERGSIRFYLRSLWENRDALPQALLRMRPWAFPVRLSRLMTAAASALVVLMMTAESWEVAGHLAPTVIALISAASLVATSAYLIYAQRLLVRAGGRALREQRVVSNFSTVVAVGLGMAVTYLAAFSMARIGGAVLFGDVLLTDWLAGASVEDIALRSRMAGLVAALSIVIGALGASFEPHGYFRHVTYIDEEI